MHHNDVDITKLSKTWFSLPCEHCDDKIVVKDGGDIWKYLGGDTKNLVAYICPTCAAVLKESHKGDPLLSLVETSFVAGYWQFIPGSAIEVGETYNERQGFLEWSND